MSEKNYKLPCLRKIPIYIFGARINPIIQGKLFPIK